MEEACKFTGIWAVVYVFCLTLKIITDLITVYIMNKNGIWSMSTVENIVSYSGSCEGKPYVFVFISSNALKLEIFKYYFANIVFTNWTLYHGYCMAGLFCFQTILSSLLTCKHGEYKYEQIVTFLLFNNKLII